MSLREEISKKGGNKSLLNSCKFNKLKGKIIEVFGTQKAFAEAVNRPQNTISQKLNGKIAISKHDIEQWASVLDIDRTDYGTYFF